jgi:large conductance mechanosensitive channel
MYVKGFRDFIARGNMIDLAVAVVIGTAFTAIVTAIVGDVITPLIGLIWGNKNSFNSLNVTFRHQHFLIGNLVSAIISFLVISAVVYFLIVKPMALLMSRITKAAEITTRDCPECLSTIPIAASRCMYCTAQVPPVVTQAPPTQAPHPHHGPRFL